MEYSWEGLNLLAKKIIQQRISVPGAQPKLSIYLEKNHTSGVDRLTLVGLEENYILKPPSANFPFLPEDKEESALTINGRKKKITRDDFEMFGKTIKLTNIQIKNTFKRILKNAENNLTQALNNSFLSLDQQTKINQLFQNRLKLLL